MPVKPNTHTQKKVKKISPPFGYFGSKNKIALEVCSALPPHNCWVEAFCGSASLTLRKIQAPIEIINDIDDEIVNVFEQLRTNEVELCKQVFFTPYSEKELVNARITVDPKKLTKVERARRFLVQSMMAINGVFGEERGGFSYSDSYSRNNRDARVNRWYNLPERLIPVVERLKSVRVTNEDARHLIKKYLFRPATLLYLDPPYFSDRTNGYNKEANDEQFHKELLKLANKANCMIFISGYASLLYDSLLTEEKGWKKKIIITATKDTNGVSHKRTEIVWMNKYFLKAQATQKINIKLTAKEVKEKKLNPQRISFRL
jgi:DNA adenine methylase